MKIRSALKSDKEIIFDMLNYNKFDFSISLNDFENIYNSNYIDFNVILYKNIRIGVVFQKKVFVNPLYWEKIDIDKIKKLLGREI